MEYLNKYVGITGNNPQSGVLLVDDLPGININSITDATVGQVGLKKLFDKCLQNTHQKLALKIRDYLMDEVEFMDVIAQSHKRSSEYYDNGTFDKSPHFKGQLITLLRFENCNVQINSISFISNTAETVVNIKVFNSNSGAELFTVSKDITIGYNQIDIDKAFELNAYRNDFFVCIDTTNLDLGILEENTFTIECNSGNLFLENKQISKLDLSPTNTELIGIDCCIHVDFTVGCNFDKIIEKNAKLFDVAIQNIVGHYLLEESLATDEFNLWSNTNYIQRVENSKLYANKASTLINQAMNSLIRKLNNSPFFKKPDIEDSPGVHVESVI